MNIVKRTVGLCLVIAVLCVTAFSLSVSAATVRVNVTGGSKILSTAGQNIPGHPETYNNTLFSLTDTTEALSDYTQKDADGDLWYHVIFSDGRSGFAYSSRISILENKYIEMDTTVMLNTSAINVRSKPSSSGDSQVIANLWSCSLKCKGKIFGDDGYYWYNIVTPGGLDGYIRGDYIDEYTYTADESFNNTVLKQFPVEYREAIKFLHTKYPNWEFYADEVPITLDQAVAAESGRKLISNNYTSLPDTWRTSTVSQTLESGYSYASDLAIKYFMSPQNFLTTGSALMFMQQKYDPSIQNREGVKSIVSGTFLDRDDYIDYIMEGAASSSVSPYVLAAMILHEQSASGSVLSSGTAEGYEGYYNFYNYAASGTTAAEIIVSGMTFAMECGWDNPETAIVGGANLYKDGYIDQNQYNYYYMNFNVLEMVWNHQYASNIHDTLSKTERINEIYGNNTSLKVVLRIPVFKGADFGTETHTHTYGPVSYDENNHWYKCTGCTQTKDVAPHSFADGVVSTAPKIGVAGVMTFTCNVCGYTKTEPIDALPIPQGKKGDINGDGVIDSTDGARLRMYFLKKLTLSDEELYRADINGDGVINSTDGARLRMHFLKVSVLE